MRSRYIRLKSILSGFERPANWLSTAPNGMTTKARSFKSGSPSCFGFLYHESGYSNKPCPKGFRTYGYQVPVDGGPCLVIRCRLRLASLQDPFDLGQIPGLKPWAEFYCPFPGRGHNRPKQLLSLRHS